MTEIERYQPTDSWVPVLGSVGDLAQRLARTQFVPRAMQGNPATVAAAILTGREMGLGPMASLRGIDVIEGKPALTAQMLAARVLSAGHAIEWRHVSDKQVTVRITRGDGLTEAEATWTIGDAQRAGLAGKQVWQRYPRHMLRARALSEAASMACPDVALGLDVDSDPVGQQPAAAPSQVTVVQLGQDDAEQPAEAVVEPEPAPEPAPDLVSRPQMRKIGALLGELETMQGARLGRDERRALIGNLIGLDTLESANDLTKEQASAVIEALQQHLTVDPDVEEVVAP